MSANPKKKAAKGGVSWNTYGKIDAEASKQLWLTRLPPKLLEVWDSAPEGTLLGHLTFTKGTPKQSLQKKGTKPIPQKLAISVSEDLAQNQPDLPLDYTLTNLTTKIPTYYPYTRADNGTVKIHGQISRSCNMQMERTERYREMCKSRLLAIAGKDKRHVKPVQNADLSLVNMGNIGSGFGSTVANFGKKVIEAQKVAQSAMLTTNRKRKFDETQPIRSILFELYGQKPCWSIKEIKAESGNRPEKEIRECLQEIGEYVKSGENKGKWQLKPEFGGGKAGAS